MGLRCLLGHDFGEPETERERTEEGNEVVVTVREVKSCTRCGATRVVAENKEIKSIDQLRHSLGIDDDAAPEPESEPEPTEGGVTPSTAAVDPDDYKEPAFDHPAVSDDDALDDEEPVEDDAVMLDDEPAAEEVADEDIAADDVAAAGDVAGGEEVAAGDEDVATGDEDVAPGEPTESEASAEPTGAPEETAADRGDRDLSDVIADAEADEGTAGHPAQPSTDEDDGDGAADDDGIILDEDAPADERRGQWADDVEGAEAPADQSGPRPGSTPAEPTDSDDDADIIVGESEPLESHDDSEPAPEETTTADSALGPETGEVEADDEGPAGVEAADPADAVEEESSPADHDLAPPAADDDQPTDDELSEPTLPGDDLDETSEGAEVMDVADAVSRPDADPGSGPEPETEPEPEAEPVDDAEADVDETEADVDETEAEPATDVPEAGPVDQETETTEPEDEAWPEQSGEDEGLDAEVPDGEPVDVDFGAGLTPTEPAREQPESRNGSDTAGGSHPRVGDPYGETEDEAEAESSPETAAEDAVEGDEEETDPVDSVVDEVESAVDEVQPGSSGASDSPPGTSGESGRRSRREPIATVDLEESRREANLQYFCAECGLTRPVANSSMRAGDICPDCRRGYIQERERPSPN